MLRTLPLLALSALVSASAPVAFADTLTFIVSDVASGSFNNQSFTNKLVTLTSTLPLDNLATSPGYFNGTGDFEYASNAGLTVTVNIQGFGTFSGADLYIFGNDSEPGLAIADGNGEQSLAFGGPLILGSTLENTPSSGPIAGPVFAYIPGSSCVPDQNVPCPPYFGTSGGNLILDSISPTGTGELIATSAVPEPSTFALLGTGFIGAFAAMRRRCRL